MTVQSRNLAINRMLFVTRFFYKYNLCWYAATILCMHQFKTKLGTESYIYQGKTIKINIRLFETCYLRDRSVLACVSYSSTVHISLFTRKLDSCRSSVGSMLYQRLRRWYNIEPTLDFRVETANWPRSTWVSLSTAHGLPSKHKNLTQCCFNVGLPSLTSTQH